MLRLRLDATYLDEQPAGLDELVTAVKYDRSLLPARLTTLDSRLTFYADGYAYLRRALRQHGPTHEVEVQLEEALAQGAPWRPIFRGVVKLAAVNWSHRPDLAQVPVEDRGWYAYLRNNRGVAVRVDLPETKNGLALTPVPRVSVTFDDPSGSPASEGRQGYRVLDVLTHLVAFLTDHRVQVRSDVLEAGGDYDYGALFSGYRLRTDTDPDEALEFKLGDFLQELHRLWALEAEVEDELSGTPTLRLEPPSYFYPSRVGLRLSGAHPVTERVQTDRLYASVKLATGTVVPQGGFLQFPSSTRWRGWREESFYLLGQANLDAELDLSRRWTYDSNALEDVLFHVTTDETYDGQTFFVQYDPGTGNAVLENWLTSGAPPSYFNPDTTNEAVALRHLGGLPADLAALLGLPPTGTFRATHAGSSSIQPDHTAPTANLNPLRFADDYTAPNFDQGNVYGNGTAPGFPVSAANSRFTAPTSGAYDLRAWVRINLELLAAYQEGSLLVTGTLSLRRYAAGGGAPLATYTTSQVLDLSSFQLNCYWSRDVSAKLELDLVAAAVPLDATDYVEASLSLNVGDGPDVNGCAAGMLRARVDGRVDRSSFFACTFASGAFGNFTQAADPAGWRAVELTFQTALTGPQREALLADRRAQVELLHPDGRRFLGWLAAYRHERDTNLTDLTLVTTPRLLPHPPHV